MKFALNSMCALVIHDWGSVLGLDYASRHPDNLRGVAFMEAIIPPAFPMPSYEALGPGAALFRSFRSGREGERLIMEENVFIETLLRNGTLTRAMSAPEMAAYNAPFPTVESRRPIYVWPNELPIGGQPSRNVEVVTRIGEWLKVSDTPKLLLYARPGAIIPPDAASWMLATYKHLDAVFVGRGAHYIQEDQPETIGRNLAHWYARLPRH